VRLGLAFEATVIGGSALVVLGVIQRSADLGARRQGWLRRRHNCLRKGVERNIEYFGVLDVKKAIFIELVRLTAKSSTNHPQE
jgi:hypothetical protein